MRPAPAHVNQFDAGGRFPNGASSTKYDCMVACGVMDLDAATGGRIVLTTTQLRARQNDQDHTGIGLDDVAVAHARTPGAPRLTFGTKTWGTVKTRGLAADGAIITGFYIALGASRASSFRGPHAIYLQRIDGNRALVNDPIRRRAAWLALADVQRFYLSGIGQAGWSIGSGSSTVSTPTPATSAGIVQQVGSNAPAPGCTQVTILAPGPLGAAQRIIPIPRESIADGCTICPSGWAKAWYAPSPVETVIAGWVPLDQTGGRPNACVAPGVQVGDRGTAANAGGVADVAGAQVAAAIGTAVEGLVGGFGEVFRNGIILVAVLGLVIIGLWLVATAPDNPLPRPRISIGA